MKIVCIDNALTSNTDLWLSERPDSSVLRNNDDFYMPNFTQDMVASVGYYLRVTRLAKCVGEMFAPRCYDTVGVAMAFTARDIVERNCRMRRPCDEAYCFDKSIALSLGSVAPSDIDKGVLEIEVGNERIASDLSHIQISLDKALSAATELLTLKTGDIVYIAATEPLSVAVGDAVSVALNGSALLEFTIK